MKFKTYLLAYFLFISFEIRKKLYLIYNSSFWINDKYKNVEYAWLYNLYCIVQCRNGIRTVSDEQNKQFPLYIKILIKNHRIPFWQVYVHFKGILSVLMVDILKMFLFIQRIRWSVKNKITSKSIETLVYAEN